MLLKASNVIYLLRLLARSLVKSTRASKINYLSSVSQEVFH